MAYDLIVTGDLMFLSPIVRGDGSPVQQYWRRFAEVDHVFCNLECVFTRGTHRADKIVSMKSDPALLPELRRAGVDVVTVANNHANDYGWEGMRESLAALDAAGVPHTGAGATIEEALRPVVLSAGSDAAGGIRRVAFIGLSCTSAGHFGADTDRPGLAGIRIAQSYVVDTVTIDEQPGMVPFVDTRTVPEDEGRALETVRNAKRGADLLVAGIHWGVSHGWLPLNQSELCSYEQPLGHALIEAGADLVVGHHPHVLHGVEIYHGRPIIYSAGNFLFHKHTGRRGRATYPPYFTGQNIPGRGEMTRYGCYVNVSWAGPGPAGEPSALELVPVWLDERGEPEPPSRERTEFALGSVERLSEKFGTRFERTANGLQALL